MYESEMDVQYNKERKFNSSVGKDAQKARVGASCTIGYELQMIFLTQVRTPQICFPESIFITLSPGINLIVDKKDHSTDTRYFSGCDIMEILNGMPTTVTIGVLGEKIKKLTI